MAMNQFKTWEELTESEQLHTTISDVFKEINGWRPRSIYPEDMTVEQLRAALDELYEDAAAEVMREKVMRTAATTDFLRTVSTTMDMCNCTFERAVVFLMDADDEAGDAEDFVFFLHLTPVIEEKVLAALREEETTV